jgi:hypothetical protein
MRKLVGVPLAVLLASAPATVGAREETIIKDPDQHPNYIAELEVHGVVAYGGGPLAIGRYDTLAFGPGFHANIRILKNGFIPKLNNSIAIGVGAELVFATNGAVRLLTPVVLQWSFWVTTHWSVFAEPGFTIDFPMSSANMDKTGEPIYFTPLLAVGARYNFSDHFAFVMRVGYPLSSVGVSFFL